VGTDTSQQSSRNCSRRTECRAAASLLLYYVSSTTTTYYSQIYSRLIVTVLRGLDYAEYATEVVRKQNCHAVLNVCCDGVCIQVDYNQLIASSGHMFDCPYWMHADRTILDLSLYLEDICDEALGRDRYRCCDFLADIPLFQIQKHRKRLYGGLYPVHTDM
jgi:hypothetical protein